MCIASTIVVLFMTWALSSAQTCYTWQRTSCWKDRKGFYLAIRLNQNNHKSSSLRYGNTGGHDSGDKTGLLSPGELISKEKQTHPKKCWSCWKVWRQRLQTSRPASQKRKGNISRWLESVGLTTNSFALSSPCWFQEIKWADLVKWHTDQHLLWKRREQKGSSLGSARPSTSESKRPGHRSCFCLVCFVFVCLSGFVDQGIQGLSLALLSEITFAWLRGP